MKGDRKYDLAVIGGGTGGLISSLIAAATGARVALIERERTGGDCLWTGCVPSKSLLAAAGAAQGMRQAGRFGIEPVDPVIDFPAVMKALHASQMKIEPHDSPERLRAEGVDVFEEDARFEGPGRLSLEGSRHLRFRSAIIATGSSPVVPPVPGLAAAGPLTTETVWDLDELPKRLLILGGGPIGCELGQAFSRLGSEVTIVEAMQRLLTAEEPESSRLIEEVLVQEGLDIRTGTEASGFETDAGLVHASLNGDSDAAADWSGDRVLVAAGRAPRTGDLGLESVGVEVDRRGSIAVDRRLRTSAKGIYAVGDVTGVMPFTHVAAQQARVATPNALFGLRRKAGYAAVPWATFTDPEIARVGISEAEARAQWGDKARIVKFDYKELDRAIVEGRPLGFSKLIADGRGKLVGATIAGCHSGEAIAGMAAFIGQGAGISDVSTQVHAYPTMAEGASRAADSYVSDRFNTPRNRAVIRPVLGLKRLIHRTRRRT